MLGIAGVTTIHLGSVSQQQRWQQQEATIMDTLAGKLHKQNDPIKRARAQYSAIKLCHCVRPRGMRSSAWRLAAASCLCNA